MAIRFVGLYISLLVSARRFEIWVGFVPQNRIEGVGDITTLRILHPFTFTMLEVKGGLGTPMTMYFNRNWQYVLQVKTL